MKGDDKVVSDSYSSDQKPILDSSLINISMDDSIDKEGVLSMNTRPNSVKGGSAKAFNPSILTSSFEKSGGRLGWSSPVDWDQPQDGVFVDRNMQQKMIEEVHDLTYSLY